MPQHRRKERLPQRLLDTIKSSQSSEFFGQVYFVEGGKMARHGIFRPKLPDGSKPKRGTPIDVQYTHKDGIITRTEFARGEAAIPVHMAHFDAETGQKFSTILDCY